MPESYAGKINRKLLKKQRIIAAAAGREPADLVLAMAEIQNRAERKLPPPRAAFREIVQHEPYPVESKARDILQKLKEGGITRFMPVFTDYKAIGEVGPVRSGRDQFFRLILPWQALYIHEGQSIVMQQYAIDFDYGKLNNNDGANGYRDHGRVNWAGKSYNNGTLALEHTMYTLSLIHISEPTRP